MGGFNIRSQILWYSSLQEVELKLPCPGVWAWLGDSFLASNKWSKETEKASLYWKQAATLLSIKLPKLTSVINRVDIRYPLIWNMMGQEGHTISLVIFPKMPNLRLIKGTQKMQIQEHSTNDHYSSKVSSVKSKEKPRNCHWLEETKEPWHLKCNVASWIESCNTKRVSVWKNWGNQRQVCKLVDNIKLMLIS